ncbi:MAG: hypothetical protein H7210_13775 [Pyrinomonadaceae bacterium]|nr:hypothetical protein [Phycisphaerales bacterium]
MNQELSQLDSSRTGARQPRRRMLPAAAVVVGISVAVVSFAMAQGQGSQPTAGNAWYHVGVAALIVTPVIVAVVLIARTAARARKQRILALDTEYARLGFAGVTSPAKDQRDSLFQNVVHLSILSTGSKGLVRVASGVVDDTPVEMIEHEYVVSTGKSAHAVQHTVASCECPTGWPVLTLTPENVLHRIGEVLGIHDIRVESETFNRAWRVKGADEAFAVTLLSPAVQTWLENTSRQESWYIGHGRVCRVKQQPLKPEEIETFMRGLVELMSLIPPEMGAWASPSPNA